jgi:GNAT superfamily N-acetyltransferase
MVKSRTINTREEAGDLTLPDGVAVPVRAIRPDDAPALQRLYGRLSKQSIHLRFFGYMKQLPDHMAKHLACVDGINRFALVALDPNKQDEIVAVVRFDREVGTCKAEYAALVEDCWQGHGLGLGMTRRLILIARARRVTCLYGLVMRGNRPMLALLRRLDLPGRERLEKDGRLVEVELQPGSCVDLASGVRALSECPDPPPLESNQGQKALRSAARTGCG